MKRVNKIKRKEDMRMRICHISTGYPLSFQGGITNYVRSLAEKQYDAGHYVSVVCGKDSAEYEYDTFIYESNKIKQFELKPRRDKSGLKILKEYLLKMKFDIIHVHMMLDVDLDVVEVLKGHKYVVSLHDYFYICPRIRMLKVDNQLCSCFDEVQCGKCLSFWGRHDLFDRIKKQIRSHVLPSFEYPGVSKYAKNRFLKYKELLEGSSILLPVSNRVKEIYEQSGISGKYHVLHIGNNSVYDYDYNYVSRINGKDGKVCIAMLGSLSYSKGADLFIKLATLLDRDRFEFVFYGRSDAYKEKLYGAGIIDKGPYVQSELKKLLSEVDLGCVFSVWEDNGPQVVMEFLNNHIPVIGTRMGGITDFVNDANGFLFDPYSEDDFNMLVNKLNCTSSEAIKRIKANIKPTTTPEEHHEAVMGIYAKILEI